MDAIANKDHLYEDITTDGLEGISIDRLPRVASRKFIKFREGFDADPLQKRYDYILSLASALNEALDVMQIERNEVIKACAHQEKQIEQLQKKNLAMVNTMQQMTMESNRIANKRAEELHEVKQKQGVMVRKLKSEKTELQAKIKELQG